MEEGGSMERGGSLVVPQQIKGISTTVAAAATVLAVVLLAALVSAGSAFAHREAPPTMKGIWEAVNRCPIENPAVLKTTGEGSQVLCVGLEAQSGSVTVGNLTVQLKKNNHQFGYILGASNPTNATIAPPGGVIAAEPVELPGGLKELICPSRQAAVRNFCQGRQEKGWGFGPKAETVMVTLESIGSPANFQLFAGINPGAPIVTVEVRLHLRNTVLGGSCYIGSSAFPIIGVNSSFAEPEPKGELFTFSAEGVRSEEPGPLLDLEGRTREGFSSFTAPPATGCGPWGFLDKAINSKVGLPASLSTNKVEFAETVTNAVGVANAETVAPNDGKELSKYWHAAIVTPEEGG
jgi:hypothetical protein